VPYELARNETSCAIKLIISRISARNEARSSSVLEDLLTVRKQPRSSKRIGAVVSSLGGSKRGCEVETVAAIKSPLDIS
jgi:hypothetical protein